MDFVTSWSTLQRGTKIDVYRQDSAGMWNALREMVTVQSATDDDVIVKLGGALGSERFFHGPQHGWEIRRAG